MGVTETFRFKDDDDDDDDYDDFEEEIWLEVFLRILKK